MAELNSLTAQSSKIFKILTSVTEKLLCFSFSSDTIIYICFQTFLIVAPLSVLYNWKDELDTWGYFKVSVLHGSKKDDDMNRIKQGKCEVALTTYEILRLYLDEFNR